MKSGVFVLTVIGIVLLLLFMVQGQNQISSEGLNLEKTDLGVIEELNENWKVNVIVDIDNNVDIDVEAEKIIDLIEGDVDLVSNKSNKIYAKLTRKDISLLDEKETVINIAKDREFKVMLQDSVGIINANKSWSKEYLGQNLTGIGKSICIIDSGVNYTHANLGGCYGNNNASSNCKVIGGYDFVNGDSDPMDDHGHGTHVSGIAAANGSIMGVAPGAKIIAIKALNAAGSGSTANIVNGINWCVTNASTFNISVISMSLGTDCSQQPQYCYREYCDDQDPDIRDAINAAVALNISVVVASGNDGNTSHISDPACISTAIAVGSTDDSDSISSFTNSWSNQSLYQVLAPGSAINSTRINGGFQVNSGTSMATPHVAGAIAILSEYLSLSGKTRSVDHIKQILNNTGKNIDDMNISGRNFTRIDVYNSLLEIDEEDPSVNLTMPSNGSVEVSRNQTFNCQATDLDLKNSSFFLWNSSGIYNRTDYMISGSRYNLSVTINDIAEGEYEWNCLFYDQSNLSAFADNNYSLHITNLSSTLINPENNNYTNSNVSFQCDQGSVSQLTNVTFFLWNSSLIYNQTNNISGTSNSTIFEYNFTNEGEYEWNCLVYDNYLSRFAVDNHTITYDITEPNISLLSPINSSSINYGNIEFQFNVNDTNVSACELFVNEISNHNLSEVIIGVNNITRSLSAGEYNWSVNCTDSAGNIGNSVLNYLSLTIPTVASSGGGGGRSGGGGGVAAGVVYTLSEKEIESGETKQVKKGDKIKFMINNQNHSVEVNSLSNVSINITVRSEPITVILAIGESKKLNLTGNESYDFYVKLESISNNRANITIKRINQKIFDDKVFYALNDSTNESNKTGEERYTNEIELNYLIWIVLGIILVFAVAIVYNIKKLKRHAEDNKKY